MAPRVSVDFNRADASERNPARTAVPLNTYGAVRDLSNAGIRLREGLHLEVWDISDETEDLLGFAEVFFDRRTSTWIAELDAAGVRYVPAGPREPSSLFLCPCCRTDAAHEFRWDPDVRCSTCDKPLLAVIAPPPDAG